MRIAAIADTHGNLHALEAVLAAIEHAAPDLVINLGDLVSGPFDPAGAAAAQMALGCPTLAGNHERQVLAGGPGKTDAFAQTRLSPAQLDWVATLPPTLSLLDGTVFACHGSPAGGDLEYLMDDIETGWSVLSQAAAIRPRLAGIGPARLVLCGHSHMPRLCQVDDVLLVNPGSVGLPAYRDPGPQPHVIEAGTPHARWALLTRGADTWSVDLRATAYDWDAAACQASEAGFDAHARWVATGRA